MTRLITPLLAALLLALAGCGGGAESFERTTTVTENQAIEAARDAVRQNDAFADSATFTAKAKGNGWQVDVVDEQSGQERMIIVSGDGTVVQYQGG